LSEVAYDSDRSAVAVQCVVDPLLTGIGANQISTGGGGADIGPSLQEGHIPGMSLDVDGSKYFLIHHTEADTVDKIDPSDLSKCVAAMTAMAYVVADMPQRFGESQGTH
jgi:carboxypeptidase Q